MIKIRLKCSHCSHTWDTKRDEYPKMCPYCKFSLYYHKPIVIKK